MPIFRRWIACSAIVGALLVGATEAQATAAVAGSAAATTYVVKHADNLSGVAERFGVSLRALTGANGITARSIIHPGQILKIPPATPPAPVIMPGVLPSDLQNASKQSLVPLFRTAAKEAGIATDLLMALAYIESGWNQSALSTDKAIGLGQLLPATAKWVAADLMGEPRLDARKAQDNLRMAAVFLRYLIKAFPGNGERALAAYFEGEALVRSKGPSKAGKNYARQILSRRVMFSKVA
jgi:soluble lytic murein transglycosylase-like protein